jgi:hypothetical protein
MFYCFFHIAAQHIAPHRSLRCSAIGRIVTICFINIVASQFHRFIDSIANNRRLTVLEQRITDVDLKYFFLRPIRSFSDVSQIDHKILWKVSIIFKLIGP